MRKHTHISSRALQVQNVFRVDCGSVNSSLAEMALLRPGLFSAGGVDALYKASSVFSSAPHEEFLLAGRQAEPWSTSQRRGQSRSGTKASSRLPYGPRSTINIQICTSDIWPVMKEHGGRRGRENVTFHINCGHLRFAKRM